MTASLAGPGCGRKSLILDYNCVVVVVVVCYVVVVTIKLDYIQDIFGKIMLIFLLGLSLHSDYVHTKCQALS